MHVSRTQTPTEGTGLIHPTFRRKTMAKVIYRGIKYDTTRTRSIQNLSEELTYRGIRHKKVAGVR